VGRRVSTVGTGDGEADAAPIVGDRHLDRVTTTPIGGRDDPGEHRQVLGEAPEPGRRKTPAEAGASLTSCLAEVR
jgi:hypothetical protein